MGFCFVIEQEEQSILEGGFAKFFLSKTFDIYPISGNVLFLLFWVFLHCPAYED